MAEANIKSLKDPELKEKLQELRRTDNYTNLIYLAQTWLFLAIVIGSAIAFYFYREAAGWSLWWNVPVTILAILAVGAGQHQLTGLTHEAAHHILLRNRYLNELVSDWFCMFPIFSTTHHYRLQHLAHHQFVNDPVRDPNFLQLQVNGHWRDFPLTKKAFYVTLLKQLWLPNLFRYLGSQAQQNTMHFGQNPYLRKGWTPSKAPIRFGFAYFFGLTALVTALVHLDQVLLLTVLPPVCWAGIMLYYWFLHAEKYHQSRVHPVIALRWTTLMRMTFMTLLVTGLGWTALWTGRPVGLYFILLWMVPLFTSFSFYMMMRQLVQHGNGDRGWLTNTRVFFINKIINYCILPFGQDLHLPHHVFATVPHYRLKELHDLLMDYPEYREQAVIVEGYFFPKHKPQTRPTVVDVLGPEYAPKEDHGVHIDATVLEDFEVEEKDEIIREGEAAVERARAKQSV